MICVLCDFPIDSIEYDLQRHTTLHSFTILLHFLQSSVGEEIHVLNAVYICTSCYNLMNELDNLELKVKAVKIQLTNLYENYKKKFDEQKFFIENEFPLQDISDSLTKAQPEENNLTDEEILEDSKGNEGHKKTKKLHQCPLCKKHFVQKGRYESHLKKCHSNLDENTIPCQNVEDKTTLADNHQDLDEEIQVKENEKNTLGEVSESFDDGVPTEERIKKLKSHRKTSNSSGLYKCSECPKLWKSQSELKAHVASHSNEKPFICEVCGQVYKHKAALDVHVGMHNGINPYTCEYCKKSFTQKGGLMRHVAIHTGEKHHQCDLCGKRFVHHTSFSIHKLSHTGKKDYKCEVCGYALMSASHLKRHMRVHTGEKKFSCGTCGKRFAERYNLISHEKLHNSTTASAHNREYRCQICDASFDRRLKLEEHLVNGHNLDPHQIQTSGYNILDEANQLVEYANGDCIDSQISTLLKEHF